ncbi:hypothetical protein AB0I76_22365, partial [Micromonospora sp. NPDC049799]
LACGLRAHHAGVVADVPQAADTLHRPGRGYAGEIAWLTRVADAYRRCPVVASTVDATTHLTATTARTDTVGDTHR